MRKLPSIFLIFAAFFFVALAITVAYNQIKKGPTTETVHPVALLGDHADPDQLIIKTGETVRFDNGDGIDHSIRQQPSDEAAVDTAGSVPVGQSYRLQFKHAGTFNYFDTLHPAIKIKVIVYDPSK
jgi:plastocyanin